MGKTVLLLMTALIISGTMLSLGQVETLVRTNEAHQINTAEVFAREMTEAGANAVLAAATRDGFFTGTAPYPLCDTLSFAGGTYRLTSYETRDNNREVEFLVEGSFPYSYDAAGNALDTTLIVRNVYRWTEPDFPGPFNIQAGMSKVEVGSGSEIRGNSSLNNRDVSRPVYYDGQRYDRYNIAQIAEWDDMWDGNGQGNIDQLAAAVISPPDARHTPIVSPGREGYDEANSQTMGDVYQRHGNGRTQPANVKQAAMTIINGGAGISLADLPIFTLNTPAIDWADSTFYTLNTSVLDHAYSTLGTLDGYTPTGTSVGYVVGANSPASPSIVYSDKPLTIGSDDGSDFVFKGSGLLLIDGGLVLKQNAKLKWKGIVHVFSNKDTLMVDLENGKLEVDGSVVLDHDKAPPGGHMDLTVTMDPTGQWDSPTGVFVPTRPWYVHTHRYGQEGGGRTRTNGTWQGCPANQVCPANSRPPDQDPQSARRITFKQAGTALSDGGDHGDHTRFHHFLNEIDSNQEVYLTFGSENARRDNNGNTVLSLDLAGQAPCGGTASGGFDASCRSTGSPDRTRSFTKGELESLVVDVGSLRLLRRLIDWDPIGNHDPDNELRGNCPTTAAQRLALLDVDDNARDISLGMRDGTCVSNNYPGSLTILRSRHNVLRLRVHDATTHRVLYDAAMFWHTKNPNNDEHEAEMAADAAFFQAVANGEKYGLVLKAGDALDIQFDLNNIVPLLRELGLDAPDVERSSTTVERDRSVTYAYGGGAPSCVATGSGGNGNTGGNGNGGNGNGGNGNGNGGNGNGNGGNGNDTPPESGSDEEEEEDDRPAWCNNPWFSWLPACR
jgi:hypothetical protein